MRCTCHTPYPTKRLSNPNKNGPATVDRSRGHLETARGALSRTKPQTFSLWSRAQVVLGPWSVEGQEECWHWHGSWGLELREGPGVSGLRNLGGFLQQRMPKQPSQRQLEASTFLEDETSVALEKSRRGSNYARKDYSNPSPLTTSKPSAQIHPKKSTEGGPRSNPKSDHLSLPPRGKSFHRGTPLTWGVLTRLLFLQDEFFFSPPA